MAYVPWIPWSWNGDLRDERTGGASQPHSGKRGKDERRAANKRARAARKVHR